MSLQKKRKELQSELSQIEKQIYDLETAYLEETKDFGNVFTGWNAYLSGEKTKARKITIEDRHFSLSSITSPASKREESKKKNPSKRKSTSKYAKNSEDVIDLIENEESAMI